MTKESRDGLLIAFAVVGVLVGAALAPMWYERWQYQSTIFGPGKPYPTPYPTATAVPTMTPDPAAFLLKCQPIQRPGEFSYYQVCALPDGSQCIFEESNTLVMCKGWGKPEDKPQ